MFPFQNLQRGLREVLVDVHNAIPGHSNLEVAYMRVERRVQVALLRDLAGEDQPREMPSRRRRYSSWFSEKLECRP